MVGCSAGSGGSGEEGKAFKSSTSPLEGCANCRLVNSGNRQW